MIEIDPVDPQDKEVWRALLEPRERYPEGWTLIGARMVTLYALEHGRTPPRFSLDADALINVRLIPRGTDRFSHLSSCRNTCGPRYLPCCRNEDSQHCACS